MVVVVTWMGGRWPDRYEKFAALSLTAQRIVDGRHGWTVAAGCNEVSCSVLLPL